MMSNQAPQPAPSSIGQVLAIVQAVVVLVPRWLVVAAGLVFVSWLGFELYLKARQGIPTTITIENDTRTKQLRTDVDTSPVERTPEQKKNAVCTNDVLRKKYGEKYGCPAP